MKKLFTFVLLSLLTICQSWAIDVTWQALSGTSSTGMSLAAGYYVVTQNATFSNSTAGGSGLTIADGATVHIYIPAGFTLTCKGANASGVTGAGAGIHVPATATVYFYGEGTVVATGGNAAQGAKGGNGYCALLKNDENFTSRSGKGGDGGGGAGAGIGTPGGTGGTGGAEVGYWNTYFGTQANMSGKNGNDGTQGGTANDAGKIYKQNSVTINATGGTAAAQNTSSATRSTTQKVHHSDWQYYYSITGSGCGGNGGSGCAAYSIGAGGPGGGGAGSGGSGGVDWSAYDRMYDSYGGNGGNGTSTTSTNAGAKGVQASGTTNKGGNGGTGARAGETKTAESVQECGAVPHDYCKSVIYNANGGNGTMNPQIVDPQEIIRNSAKFLACGFTREGFTFAGWNTERNGSGTSYSENGGIPTNDDKNTTVTLYAQWTAQKITATIDYTYRTGENAYDHMPEDVQAGENPFTRKVRAILRDHSGNVLKDGEDELSFVLTAPDATDPSSTVTSSVDTHKRAAVTLTVVKGEACSLTGSSPDYTLTLDADTYTDYRSVDFEVMNADGTAKAAHWVTTEVSATNYVFKYEGMSSENMFDLTWRVNLKNLSMYPSDIFVKPMRKGTHTDNDGNTDLVQIPAMENIKGVECELAGYIDDKGNNVTIEAYNAKTAEEKAEFNKNGGAYYTGEYNVLKSCTHAHPYNYEIGLTGFILDGLTYYLAEAEGAIPNDMVSSAVATSDNTEITFNRLATDIPVLLLMPNGDGATVSGRSDYKLYVDNHLTRTVNLKQFEPVRPNYDFVGWVDAYDKTKYGTNDNYQFKIGTQATTSLVAQWVRSAAPEVDPQVMEEDNANFTYSVKVTDALGESAITKVQYIFTDSETEPAKDASGWTPLQKSGEAYTLTIQMVNEYRGKYLWVKAENEDKYSVTKLGKVRSVFRLTANANPKSTQKGTWDEDGEGNLVFHESESGTAYSDYYSTFYYGEHSFTVSNATAYTAEIINEDQLRLVKIEPNEQGLVVIPNGTGVILRKSMATDGAIELEECDEATYQGERNALSGVDDDENEDSGYDYYVFSYTEALGLGFYDNQSTTLAAHKAFVKLGAGQKVSAFTLNFGDGNDPIIEAIREIEATEKPAGVTFDLSGRKVSNNNMRGGIYINAGKKIMHQ